MLVNILVSLFQMKKKKKNYNGTNNVEQQIVPYQKDEDFIENGLKDRTTFLTKLSSLVDKWMNDADESNEETSKDWMLQFIEEHINVYKIRLNNMEERLKARYGVAWTVNGRRGMNKETVRHYNELKCVEMGRDCWMLAHRLLSAVSQPNTEPLENREEEEFSHARIVERILSENTDIRINRAVVEWLEEVAELRHSKQPPIQALPIGYFFGKYTLRNAQMTPNSEDLGLDLDATFRTKTRLNSNDQDEEERLLREVWCLLRSGRLQDAVDLCREFEQHWRAATLNGGHFWHDSQVTNNGLNGVWRNEKNIDLIFMQEGNELAVKGRGNSLLYTGSVNNREITLMEAKTQNNENAGREILPMHGRIDIALKTINWLSEGTPKWTRQQTESTVVGNRRRFLWKAQCRAIASTWGMRQIEAAIYGVLGGDVEKVLPVCDNWADSVWTYFKIMNEYQIDNELWNIRKKYNDIDVQVKPKEMKHFNANRSEIFHELAKIDVRFKEDGDLYTNIQQQFIMGNMNNIPQLQSEYFMKFGLREEDLKNADLYCYVLLGVHLYLSVAPRHCEASFHGIILIRAYIRCLIALGMNELVAVYCQLLPQDIHIQLYAGFLSQLPVNDRHHYLQLGAMYCKDDDHILKIVQTLFEMMIGEEGDEKQVPEKNKPQSSDQDKIRTIECFFLDDIQWEFIALTYTNRLFRYFIRHDQLISAEQLKKDVEEFKMGDVDEDNKKMSKEEENQLREFLSWGMFMKAEKNYNEWLQFFVKKIVSEKVVIGESNISEDALIEEKEDLTEWREHEQNFFEAAIKSITETLTMDGGLFMDLYPGTEKRRKVMEETRRKCIPRLIRKMYDMCNRSQRYNDSLLIADLVANEEHALYRSMPPSALAELLYNMRQSHINLDIQQQPSKKKKYDNIHKIQNKKKQEYNLQKKEIYQKNHQSQQQSQEKKHQPRQQIRQKDAMVC